MRSTMKPNNSSGVNGVTDERKKSGIPKLPPISPSKTQERKLARKASMSLRRNEQNFKHEFVYKSCCLEVDKRVLEFMCKMVVLLSALVFSMYGVIATEEHAEIYFSVISSMISLFVQPPSIQRRKPDKVNLL